MRIPARLARALEAANRPAHPLLAWHEAFIRGLPCLGCGKRPPSECARLCPAMDVEVSQRELLPLCGPETVWQDCCHSRMHFQGSRRFWAGLGIDPRRLARLLWRVSGDLSAGQHAILLARQQIAAVAEQSARGRVSAPQHPIRKISPAAFLPDRGRPADRQSERS
jgi:hypothetical protein